MEFKLDVKEQKYKYSEKNCPFKMVRWEFKIKHSLKQFGRPYRVCEKCGWFRYLPREDT